MRIVRTMFQNAEVRDRSRSRKPQFIVVIDMEEHAGLSTTDIPDIALKIESALPGIFPADDDLLTHSCGGFETGISEHSFREEIERGTDIPHLLEHLLLYMLGRRSPSTSAVCGQRSTDIQRGITTHYYLMIDYPSKLEAVAAADLGFEMVSAWIEGRGVAFDPLAIIDRVGEMAGSLLA